MEGGEKLHSQGSARKTTFLTECKLEMHFYSRLTVSLGYNEIHFSQDAT